MNAEKATRDKKEKRNAEIQKKKFALPPMGFKNLSLSEKTDHTLFIPGKSAEDAKKALAGVISLDKPLDESASIKGYKEISVKFGENREKKCPGIEDGKDAVPGCAYKIPAHDYDDLVDALGVTGRLQPCWISVSGKPCKGVTIASQGQI